MDTLKELREETGLSFAQIKKALETAGGDKVKALEILGEYKEAQAEKKADREVGVTTVASYVHGSGLSGALVELACETDFVARNDEFKELAKDIAMQVVAMSPVTLEGDDDTALLKQVFIKDGNLTVEGKLQSAIQKFGENVKITRFVRYGA
jgi:elongation factor Ts